MDEDGRARSITIIIIIIISSSSNNISPVYYMMKSRSGHRTMAYIIDTRLTCTIVSNTTTPHGAQCAHDVIRTISQASVLLRCA